MKKYTIGIDFGTLSARAIVVDTADGTVVARAQQDYPHGVMDRTFLDGSLLKGDCALQDPEDYLEVLENVITSVLNQVKEQKIDVQAISGIGIDVTSTTMLPVTADGNPMSIQEAWKMHPHAYVKLWKHHGASLQAEKINAVASQRKEAFLERYGRIISSEWMLPKALEILEEDPELYNAADYLMEMTDYLVWHLTGTLNRGACAAGYKALWAAPSSEAEDGYPDPEFFAAVDERMRNFAQTKLAGKVLPVGARAGMVSLEVARRLGLSEHTAVATGFVDAHAAVPALKVAQEGTMVSILGTSACHMLLGKSEKIVPGTCGYVKDGIMPGFFGYEAGQPCFGDLFAWWMENELPAGCLAEAKTRGVNVHQLLSERAAQLKPGQSGLLCLDWWNGNRSILVNSRLSGLMVGLTMQTRPEEIYRALIESVCFGTRMIVENFRQYGMKVEKMIATGGIALKNPLLMQIMADILQMPVQVAGTEQSGALGSAIAAACSAGKENGGYDSMEEASFAMGSDVIAQYLPNSGEKAIYDQLFAQYKKLHDLFGRELDVMQNLKTIAQQQRG